MAYSRVVKVGNGSATQFAVNFALDYLREEDVTCRVGAEVDGAGNPAYRPLTFISTNLIQVSGAPAGNGVAVVFTRTVDKDILRVDYHNGDELDEDNLMTSQKQLMMATHEVLDGRLGPLTQVLDAGGNKIINLATATDPTDAANKGYVDNRIADNAALALAAAAARDAARYAQAGAEATKAATDAVLVETQVVLTNTENVLDDFERRYLGARASAPTTDNDGGALQQGALYYQNNGLIGMKLWDGAQWVSAYSTASDVATSVFGRKGDVAALAGDYTAAKITNVPAASVTDLTVQAAINSIGARVASSEASVTGLLKGWRIVSTTKSAAYSIVNGDKGATIGLNGNACYTVSLGPAANYDTDFAVMLTNLDGTRAKWIAPNGYTSPLGFSGFFLWPKQTCLLFKLGGVWIVNPTWQRWKCPVATTLFVDRINGNDANDGLAAGAGNALQTIHQAARVIIKDCLDLSGVSVYPSATVIIQLADNASAGETGNVNYYETAHIAYAPVGGEGRCTILIQGNAASPQNVVVVSPGSPSIGAYGPVNLELRNLQLGHSSSGSTLTGTCIEASDGANVRLMGGVYLGSAASTLLATNNGGRINIDAQTICSGWACQYVIQAVGAGSRVSFNSNQIVFNHNINVSGSVVLSFSHAEVECTNGFGNGQLVAGAKYSVANYGLITGVNSIPGTAGSNSNGLAV